ncbi:MAG: MerR family transcriptional regulator [Fimbriimonas sp.]|nr:MerR family transcriptional regulator [Fimbriimonas sp.]
MSLTYTIGTLSGLTGVSQHTIRAWERRYNALSPGRTDTNRRVYGEDDAERLLLLKGIVATGHPIGQVAQLPTEQLRELGSSFMRTAPAIGLDSRPLGADYFLVACQNAILRFDPEGLEEVLVRGHAAMGIQHLLDRVIIPLIADVEARWLNHSLGIAQEHMMSAVLKTFLYKVKTSMPGSLRAPKLLITTLRNELHEIGALMAAIAASTAEWGVVYLGPNMPAESIVLAGLQASVRAIAISVVYPTNEEVLCEELRILRRLLGPGMPIIVGGRSAHRYAETLTEIGAIVHGDVWSLRHTLNQIVTLQSVGLVRGA